MSETAEATTTRYAVEVLNDDGTWIEMPGFSSDDRGEAERGAVVLNGSPFAARVVEVTTLTRITETIVWGAS